MDFDDKSLSLRVGVCNVDFGLDFDNLTPEGPAP